MKNPHIINLVYSVFIMIIGLAGFTSRYLTVGDLQFTALIPFLFGIVLLFLTNGIRRQNRIVSHIAVLITAVLGIFTLIMMIKNMDEGFILTSKGIIFSLIILSSFIVLTMYIIRFMMIRKK